MASPLCACLCGVCGVPWVSSPLGRRVCVGPYLESGLCWAVGACEDGRQGISCIGGVSAHPSVRMGLAAHLFLGSLATLRLHMLALGLGWLACLVSLSFRWCFLIKGQGPGLVNVLWVDAQNY